MNDETKLVTLCEKVELSHQMPGVKVYDNRDITRFSECYACYDKDLVKGVWFILNYAEPLPKMYESILKDSKKPYIVSAHFPIWTFVWHWGSAEDSEEEYGLIRTDEQGIQKAIARLQEGNSAGSGDGIIYGREVDVKKTVALLERLQSRKKQKRVNDFLKLSPEEQKKKLEELL